MKHETMRARRGGDRRAVFSGADGSKRGSAAATRTEHDLLGEKQVPADAYYGVQTARALENFQISGIAINHYPGFVEAWAIVKLAAARANTDVGAMKPERLAAIEKASEAMMAGKYHDQFLVDWFQGGAGTSTNMNANEVHGQRRARAHGPQEGRVPVRRAARRPEHVAVDERLVSDGDQGRASAAQRQADRGARAARRVVPREGQRSSSRSEDGPHGAAGRRADDGRPGVPRVRGSLESEIQLLRDAEKYLYAVNMGATAIGTGHQRAEGLCVEASRQQLAKLTGKPIVPAKDMFAATWDQQGFVVYSSALKSVAIKLSKIASDLILLASGPRAGLAEINLPAMQPGSSIMPGKVNPVMPELMNVIAFRVMGNDARRTLAAHSGQLQLNAYEPLEGSRSWSRRTCCSTARRRCATKCVDGITVNEKVLEPTWRPPSAS